MKHSAVNFKAFPSVTMGWVRYYDLSKLPPFPTKGTSCIGRTCLHCHLAPRSDHSQLTRHKIWKSGPNFVKACQTYEFKLPGEFCVLFLQIFIRKGFSNPQKVNIILLVIYRKYKEARKKGIFVWHFFTGHQVTVMDSQRQPEAQNEPWASAKSRTMPPNYCRCRLFPLKRQNATKFCQNSGFCNRSKPPQRRFSPDAFVRLIVCVWFPLFAALTEILASQIE